MVLHLPLRGEIFYIFSWKNARHMGYYGARDLTVMLFSGNFTLWQLFCKRLLLDVIALIIVSGNRTIFFCHLLLTVIKLEC